MIRALDVFYTDDLPMRPADAQFGVTIDFVRGKSDPVDVFSAMAEMLSAFKQMDRILIGAVAPDLAPVTVIEDVEAASITTWVRNILAKVDDQALKEFDPKQQIGAYVVKAKYRVIQFLDDREEAHRTERLAQLRRDLEELAAPLRGELIPPHVDVEALIPPMNLVQDAKGLLGNGETVTLKSDYQPDYKVDVKATAPVEKAPEPSKAIVEADGEMEMLLLIKKPDFIGKSQWEFKHDKTAISANIEDEAWLERFHRGEERIVPPAR